MAYSSPLPSSQPNPTITRLTLKLKRIFLKKKQKTNQVTFLNRGKKILRCLVFELEECVVVSLGELGGG